MARGKSVQAQQRTPTVTENQTRPDDPQRRGISAVASPQSQALLAPAQEGQAPGDARARRPASGSLIG